MKKLFLFFVCSIVLSMCSDLCDDINCFNGGVCDEGICECPTGFSGINCEDKEGYNCIGGSCILTTNNPTYTTYQACSNNCNTPCNDSCIWANDGVCDEPNYCDPGTDCTDCMGNSSTSGYNCFNNNCTYVYSNAQYSSLTICQNNCGSNNSDGYNCVNNSCQYVSSNAEYSSLSICESNCSNTSGYNCNGNGCDYVSSNAQYGSLSSCQNNCGPQEGQLMIWTSHSTPCGNGVIEVYVDNNYWGGLSSYFSSVPPCNNVATITKTVEVGTYTVTAVCGNLSWPPFNVPVNLNNCSRFELE